MTDSGPEQVACEDTDQYRINKYFCKNYRQMIADLLAGDRTTRPASDR